MSRESGPALLSWDDVWPRLADLRALLAEGGVLAIPTESSYALAVDPCNPEGVETVYRLKGRSPEKALLVLAANEEQLRALGVVFPGNSSPRLAAVWPAALTAVLPLDPKVRAEWRKRLPAAGGATLAVRIPAHAQLRRLLEVLGPLTGTSANRSGEPPVLDPQQLAAWLPDSAVIVDDGILPGGAPSTLVEWQEGTWSLLRQGAFPFEAERCRR